MIPEARWVGQAQISRSSRRVLSQRPIEPCELAEEHGDDLEVLVDGISEAHPAGARDGELGFESADAREILGARRAAPQEQAEARGCDRHEGGEGPEEDGVDDDLVHVLDPFRLRWRA
jgi:hypothetical protein